MEAKICGVKDKFTLNYIVSHPNAPQYVGFICNYKKSKRFIPEDILRDLIKIKKKKSKYVAVLVSPSDSELEVISKMPFDFYQIYNASPIEIKRIREKFKIKIIVAITIKEKKDVAIYKDFEEFTDIILFDSKGYEKSLSFNHNLIKDINSNCKIMLAGDITVDHDLDKLKEITDIIDISGGLETSGLKDISKINNFLNKIKDIKNET